MAERTIEINGQTITLRPGETFSNMDLSDRDLSNLDLTRSFFINTILTNTNFSGTNLTGCSFTGATIRGTNFSGANLSAAVMSRNSRPGIQNVNFSGANLEGANMVRSSFSNCNFRNANFTNANLNATRFLGGNSWAGANLTGIDYTGSNLFDTTAEQDLRGVTMPTPRQEPPENVATAREEVALLAHNAQIPPAPQPVAPAVQSFRIGDQVEFNNGRWVPARINNIVYNVMRGNQLMRGRDRESIRVPGQPTVTELNDGQAVEINYRGNWRPATVQSRSYVITLNNGRDARDLRVVEPNAIRGTAMTQAQAVLAEAQAPPAVAVEAPVPSAPQTPLYQIGETVEIDELGRTPGNYQPRWIQIEINNITYDVRNNNNGREVLRKSRSQIRRPGQAVDENVVYQNGEQVEALINRNWVPATILRRRYHFINHGQGDISDDVLMRRPGEAVPAVQAQAQAPANPLDRPLTAEERIDFTAAFNRMPEAVRPQLLASLEVGTVGAARNAIEAVLRIGRPAATAQGAVVPAQGVAFEIHNAFANIKFDRLMEILRAGIGSARNFKDREFPLMPLVRNIENNPALSPEKKRELSEKIERIFETLSQYQNYRASIPYIVDAIQYILMQPQEVIDAYIDTFITDCLKAYSTGRGESCIKGMYERVFMSFRDTMSTICLDQIQGTGAAPLCKPEYVEIFKCFYEDIPADELNNLSKDWYGERSEAAESMSPENRIEDFVSFVRTRLNNPDRFRAAEGSIRRYADRNINVLFGGRRRKKRVIKTVKRKRNVTKKLKKRQTKRRY